LEENRKQKCRFASNINRLFRLTVRDPVDNQSLKLRWMNLEEFFILHFEEEGLDGVIFNKTERKHIFEKSG
jgi:hypothetical protein